MARQSEYLLALYITEHREDPPVSPSAVADMVERSPATVIEVLHRLDEEGLLVYEPYEGVTLTESGRRKATELHDAYVKLSWFFRSVLELEDYESEAMELAGVVSPEVANRLAATLPYDGPPPESS
jgi:DtxR family Mn-dependent transcriptional regulator